MYDYCFGGIPKFRLGGAIKKNKTNRGRSTRKKISLWRSRKRIGKKKKKTIIKPFPNIAQYNNYCHDASRRRLTAIRIRKLTPYSEFGHSIFLTILRMFVWYTYTSPVAAGCRQMKIKTKINESSGPTALNGILRFMVSPDKHNNDNNKNGYERIKLNEFSHSLPPPFGHTDFGVKQRTTFQTLIHKRTHF